MKKTEKELFLSYVNSQRQNFYNELYEIHRRIRYRKIDITDCLEYMLLLKRIAAFDEFVNTSFVLLHLGFDFDDKGELLK